MTRFQMNFSYFNKNNINDTNNKISNLVTNVNPNKVNGNIFNTAMISRVHNTRPGCSSCGKKVY